ncbi:MAG: hypothetical protein U0R17_06760 [Acidimicrobiia bacterium]
MKTLILLIVLDSLIWVFASVVIGYVCNKLPKNFLDKSIVFPVSRKTSRRIEKYLKIKKWKDAMPEAGGFFNGGISKKSLMSLNKEGLNILLYEAKRAELVHYLIFSVFVIFFLINPVSLAVIMFIYAFIANIPCIYIQRYNRSRILKVMERN